MEKLPVLPLEADKQKLYSVNIFEIYTESSHSNMFYLSDTIKKQTFCALDDQVHV